MGGYLTDLTKLIPGIEVQFMQDYQNFMRGQYSVNTFWRANQL